MPRMDKTTPSQTTSEQEPEIYEMMARENQDDTPSKQGEIHISGGDSLGERVGTGRSNMGKDRDSAVLRQ